MGNCENDDCCRPLDMKDLQLQMDNILEKELHSLQTLSRALCHELNNVLGGMLGYSQLAESNPNDVELIKRAFAVIVRGSKRASEFINRLGHFSGFEGKNFHEIADISPIINDCLELLKPELEHSCIKIEQDISPVPPSKFNPAQIRLMFLETFQNAYDALQEVPESQRSLKVSTKLVEENKVLICIKDSGRGFDEEAKEHIFNPFFSTKDILGGGKDSHSRGMGLAIAKRLVELHEGTIGIGKTDEDETCVCITLPVFPELQTTLKTIVVVDDEDVILKIYGKFLKKEGYNVIEFNKAEDALIYIESNKTDLVILDQNMPEMCGTEMLQVLRSKEIKVPVIIVTAAKTEELARKALEFGAISVFSKPINRAKLVFLVGRILNISCDGLIGSCRKDIMPSERILILDSDLLTREVISIALKRSGYAVTSVEGFGEAIKSTEDEYYDMIMIDPFLHDGSGANAIKTMRKKNPYTPIVMLTGVASPKDLTAASLAGATHTIEKPLDIQVLLDKVRGILDIFAEQA